MESTEDGDAWEALALVHREEFTRELFKLHLNLLLVVVVGEHVIVGVVGRLGRRTDMWLANTAARLLQWASGALFISPTLMIVNAS